MKKRPLILALVLAMALQLAFPVAASASSEEADPLQPFDVTAEDSFSAEDFPYEMENVLVKLAAGNRGRVTEAMKTAGVRELEPLFETESGNWFIAHLTDGTFPCNAIEALREMRSVVVAEYNYIYETDGFSSEIAGINENPEVVNQWGMEYCHVEESWKYLQEQGYNPGGDAGVVVAVIDTGVDYTHEDLHDNMWVNEDEIPNNGRDDDNNGYVDDYYGVDLVAGRGNGSDDHGHGTHVAGIIAADNNNTGIVGVAYNTKIMAVKAGMSSGYFNQATIAKAILYAYENGADVINMSFGGTATSIAVEDALATAYTRCVLIASAGNNGVYNEGLMSEPNYPAAYSYVLGVMSVDPYGVESGFTNWDVTAFNDVEYELYAPGESIISTIPGNRYATWNGTSMAAPLVSGMAALLRGYYSDPSMYPTKFIYGQLASTSERRATCVNPAMHGPHNLPQIVDLYEAFTRLPNPEIHVGSYQIFDTENLCGNKKNNGDGVIDAGEDIAIGFELRNRWGMSKDTVVSVDALSVADIPCPYIEFSSDGVNWGTGASADYDSVGTYSTQDAGKIMDGDLWVGWQTPIYARISKDCPNDYIIAMNVHVSAGNALNEEDTKIYTSEKTVNLAVRRGVVLPSTISEDMTLTSENYYIIENAVTIKAGATVRVEAGTNIQFWTDDPNDAYADQYIAKLIVNGHFITEGTEEQPVRMFPSELMSDYGVELSGERYTIDLNGTEITNLISSTTVNYGFIPAINSAVGCTFLQNYKNKYIYTRTLNGSRVQSQKWAASNISIGYAEDSVFYKLGSVYDAATVCIQDSERCLFVDSAIRFGSNDLYHATYEDCVFLGNNNYWDSNGLTSDFYRWTNGSQPYFIGSSIRKTARYSETGSVYVQVQLGGYWWDKLIDRLAETLGWIRVVEESPEVTAFLRENGISEVSSNGWYVFKIPGDIWIESLSFQENEIILDREESYQLSPEIKPFAASALPLRYFSSNQTVAAVDAAGLVTPVSEGEAVIYAFSEDMQVYDTVQVTVRSVIHAETVGVPEHLQIPVGGTAQLHPQLYPLTSTKNPTYTSSNASVASVSSRGLVTGLQIGTAAITVKAGTVSTETVVDVVEPVESIRFLDDVVFLDTASEMRAEELGAVISPANATNQTLVWESSNPEICRVTEDGTVLCGMEGVATLRATAEYTDVSAELLVNVAEGYQISPVIKMQRRRNSFFALQDNGSIWVWGDDANLLQSTANPKRVPNTVNGEDFYPSDFVFSPYSGDVYFLDAEGRLLHCYCNSQAKDFKPQYTDYQGIAELKAGYDGVFALLKDGGILASGTNKNGNLGVGDSLSHSDWVSVNLSFAVKEVLPTEEARTFFLCENGELYVAGLYNGTVYEDPCLIARDIDRVQGNYAFSGENVIDIRSGSPVTSVGPGEYSVLQKSNEEIDYYIQNGTAYLKGYNSLGQLGIGSTQSSIKEYQPVTKLAGKTVTDIFVPTSSIASSTSPVFFTTSDGRLYAAGSSQYNALGPNSSNGNSTEPVAINLGLNYPSTPPQLRFQSGEMSFGNLKDVVMDQNGNVTSAKLEENDLLLPFDTVIIRSSGFSGIKCVDGSGAVVTLSRGIDLSTMTLSRAAGFVNGKTYTVTIPQDAVISGGGVANQQITVTFTYCSHEYDTVYTAPTCTAPGSYVSTCTVCGHEEITIVEALGHEETEIPAVSATCTAAGSTAGVRCTRCGEVLTAPEATDPLEHSPVTDEAVAPGCTASGLTEGSHCTVCGAVITAQELVAPTGHTYVDGVCACGASAPDGHTGSYLVGSVQMPTCTEDGKIEYYSTESDLDRFEETLPALNHAVVTDEAVAPDCIHSGLTEGSHCARCGEVLTAQETVTATGHSYASIHRDPDCVFYGYDAQKCGVCGDVIDYVPIEPTGHTLVPDEGSNPDCTHSGLTEGCHCSSCMEVLTPQLLIPALGHDWITETVLPTEASEGYVLNCCARCEAESLTVLPQATPRKNAVTDEEFAEAMADFTRKGYDTLFWHCAFLNRTIDDDVTKWLRITAPSGSDASVYGMGGNWWGSADERMINLQIVDYNDFTQLCDINEGEYLTTPPEDTFPFVTDAYLLTNGNRTTIVGNEEVTFVVKFNRDMDTDDALTVCFGSSYPYAEYEISGEFTDARTWQGTSTLKTIIENGYQFWSIDGGRSAADENGHHLKHYKDWARFGFSIDTTSAMSMTMQGYADTTGIHLSWEQDDYATLAGYNVYRSDKEDGTYKIINTSIILNDNTMAAEGKTTGSFTDTDVKPGQRYYYYFTVVPTDLGGEESQPSGSVSVVAFDTKPPEAIHTPIVSAVTGSKLGISAVVTDNIAVEEVTLYYRTVGTEAWSELAMSAVNDKYSAFIPAAQLSTNGLEYYIVASDGGNEVFVNGRTAENPYSVLVQQGVDSNSKGDVDGNGVINLRDALMILQAMVEIITLDDDQFLRADLNGNGVLEITEALKILQYYNGSISSLT